MRRLTYSSCCVDCSRGQIVRSWAELPRWCGGGDACRFFQITDIWEWRQVEWPLASSHFVRFFFKITFWVVSEKRSIKKLLFVLPNGSCDTWLPMFTRCLLFMHIGVGPGMPCNSHHICILFKFQIKFLCLH